MVPEAQRASSGVALQCGDQHLQLDLGRGVVQRMADQGINPLGLDTIGLSHIHPDHCCDLVPWLFARNYVDPPASASPLVRLFGPPGVSQLCEDLARTWSWLRPRFDFQVTESDNGTFSWGGGQVEMVSMAHGSLPSIGFRVTMGSQVVAYTGDTGPGVGLLSLARDAHILISECSYPDSEASAKHMSPTALADAAQRCNVEHLVVTHLYPQTDPGEVERVIRSRFTGRVDLAHDGLTLYAGDS